jgi:2-keto-4-pentenoate hydratase
VSAAVIVLTPSQYDISTQNAMMCSVSISDARVTSALRAQLDDWRTALAAGGERVGWKIGLNIPEIQARFGIGEPVVGHLTSAPQVEPGGTYAVEDPVALRAEAEVALRVGEAGSVDAWAVAIELVDVGRPSGGIEGIVAGNVFHRAFVLGPFADTPPAEGANVSLTADGRLLDAGTCPADFDDMVGTVGRHLAAAGEQLLPGDVIIAGALAHEAVAPGAGVVVEIDGLGRLEVAISG